MGGGASLFLCWLFFQLSYLALSKGNQVNIPEPGCGYMRRGASRLFFFLRLSLGGDLQVYYQCGNAIELGDAGENPGKSFLFFLTSNTPWNQFIWR